MNEVYVTYNGTLYVPYIDGYVYWDVICSLHERITERRHEFLSSQAFILAEFARLHVVGHATLVMLGVGKTRDG